MTTNSFEAYDALLTRCGRGEPSSRKLTHNTWVQRSPLWFRKDNVGVINIKYHNTHIITYYSNGTIDMDAGGWWSKSTFDRMHTFSPFSFYCQGGVYYVYTGTRTGRPDPHYKADRYTFEFTGHMRFFPNRSWNPVNRRSCQLGDWHTVHSVQAERTAKAKLAARQVKREKRRTEKYRTAVKYGKWLIKHGRVHTALGTWIRNRDVRHDAHTAEVVAAATREKILASLPADKVQMIAELAKPRRRVIEMGDD